MIVRAEGAIPFTSARSVSLLKADWNADFVSCMANSRADSSDHYVDAFVHGLKAFVGTGSDFLKPTFLLANEDQAKYEEQPISILDHNEAIAFGMLRGEEW
jgi:hypothetical protein